GRAFGQDRNGGVRLSRPQGGSARFRSRPAVRSGCESPAGGRGRCSFRGVFGGAHGIFSCAPAKETCLGEVTEWSKVHAWKACVQQCTAGSNPALSARSCSPATEADWSVSQGCSK